MLLFDAVHDLSSTKALGLCSGLPDTSLDKDVSERADGFKKGSSEYTRLKLKLLADWHLSSSNLPLTED